MVHYGRTPAGDLEICANGEDIRKVYGILESTGLLDRRYVYKLKTYIEDHFKEELETESSLMTMPTENGKGVSDGNT